MSLSLRPRAIILLTIKHFYIFTKHCQGFPSAITKMHEIFIGEDYQKDSGKHGLNVGVTWSGILVRNYLILKSSQRDSFQVNHCFNYYTCTVVVISLYAHSRICKRLLIKIKIRNHENCICFYTVMAKNIGTLGKYDQRSLWKFICIVNPFDL